MDEAALSNARNNATAASDTAAKYNSQGYTVADELRKALGERYGESGIAKDSAEARGTFLAQAPQDRLAVQGMIDNGTILSPAQQQAILAAKRGSALVPLIGANLVDSAAFGTIEDLVNSGTHAWQAQSSYAGSQAQQAQQTYQSLMDEAVKRAQIKQIQDELAMKQAMAPFEQQLIQAQIANTNRSNTGGGSSDRDLLFTQVEDTDTGEIKIIGTDKRSGDIKSTQILVPAKQKSSFDPLKGLMETGGGTLNALRGILPSGELTPEQRARARL